MKASKIRRKKLNSLRALDELAWPARQYKIPPTSGRAATRTFHVGTCERTVGETEVKRGKLRRKQTVAVPCGGKLIARLGSGARRRVYCENCRSRKRDAQRLRRLEKRINRFYPTANEQTVESRGRKFLGKLRRSGVR